MSFKTTHARHDPAICLAHGLFRSLAPGERKRQKLNVKQKHGEDHLEFSAAEPLGAEDLRVYQGLIAMGAVSGDTGRGIILRSDVESEEGRQLRDSLSLEDGALEETCLVVRGSFQQLAHEIGYDTNGGGAFRVIRESIERLWKVSVVVQRGKHRQGFRLLAQYASEEGAGKLFVALNPRLAQAILGGRQGRHVRIEMPEVRTLRSDAARLIHQRLCGWIDRGKPGRIGLDALCGYAWPDQAAKAETMKKRRQAARRALNEIAALGWEIEEYAAGKFIISRPLPDCSPATARLLPNPCPIVPAPLSRNVEAAGLPGEVADHVYDSQRISSMRGLQPPPCAASEALLESLSVERHTPPPAAQGVNHGF